MEPRLPPFQNNLAEVVFLIGFADVSPERRLRLAEEYYERQKEVMPDAARSLFESFIAAVRETEWKNRKAAGR